MLKVTINNKKEYAVELENSNSGGGKINGTNLEWDIIEIKEGSFHLIKDNKSYNIEVVKANYLEKKLLVNINGNKYNIVIKDKYDELLKKLGFDSVNNNKIEEIKAPMPGLVVDIVVEEGNAVKKGDPVIVLEAMKMENILKSPADGIIKKVNVKKGMAVEKNQVLISFA